MPSLLAYSGVANPLKVLTASDTMNLTSGTPTKTVTLTAPDSGIMQAFLGLVNETTQAGGTYGGAVKIELLRNNVVISEQSIDAGASTSEMNFTGLKFYDDMKILAGAEIRAGETISIRISHTFTGTSTFYLDINLTMVILIQPRRFIIP